LCTVGEAFDTLRITVVKYWYDPKWKDRMLCEDLILAEFSVIEGNSLFAVVHVPASRITESIEVAFQSVGPAATPWEFLATL